MPGFILLVTISAILLVSVSAFTSNAMLGRRTQLTHCAHTEEEPSSYRSMQVEKVKSAGVAAFKVLLGSSLLASKPAYAAKLSDCNKVLSEYGLPPILFVPPGFSPLISEYGRGNARDGYVENPILVQFAHPSLWVEARTSVNNNGEAGTISANDYIKGDSAFLYTYPLENGDGRVSVDNKKLIEKVILKGLTQKGDATESFKVTNLRPGAKGVNGQEYVLADVFYKVNTEAGFLISRQGFVSITSVGKDVQSLTAVSTDKRYRNNGMKEKLSDIADSFRIYKLQSGIFTKPDAAAGE